MLSARAGRREPLAECTVTHRWTCGGPSPDYGYERWHRRAAVHDAVGARLGGYCTQGPNFTRLSSPSQPPPTAERGGVHCNLPSQATQELYHRLADLGRGVLLDEVAAGHGHLDEVGPGPGDLPLPADQDRAGVGADERLRQPRVSRQPVAPTCSTWAAPPHAALHGDVPPSRSHTTSPTSTRTVAG